MSLCIIIYHSSLLSVEITKDGFIINCDEEYSPEKKPTYY